MANTTYSFEREDASFLNSVRWGRAVQAGLIVGAITFLLSRGIPWVGSGAMNPAVMGREIAPGKEPIGVFFLSLMGLHFSLGVAYALVIAPIVHGFKNWVAGLIGGVLGLVLYFINYAITGMIMDLGETPREWPAIVLHIVFGILCAELYKGFARQRSTALLP